MKESHFKTNDGETLFFKTNFDINQQTSTPPLLFNYGLVCSEHHWKYQIDYFKDKYPIIIHDYRGHYKSSGADKIKNLTINQLAHDTIELLNYLQLKKAHVIGHSMGANVSLEMAIIDQNRLCSMTLISGSIFSTKDIMLNSNITDILIPYLEKLFHSNPHFFSAVWKTNQYNPLIKNIIHKSGFNSQEVSKEFVQVYLEKLGELGPEIFLQLFNSMSNHTISMSFDKIEIPTLIISGDNDKVIPHYTQFFAHNKIKNSEFYVLRKGSHVPQVDYPLFINERLKLFIAKTQVEV